MSRLTAMRPISCNGWRTVVSIGLVAWARSMSSKPAIGQVIGDAQAALGRCGHRADGGLVVESDQRCRPLMKVEQLASSGMSALCGWLGRTYQGRIWQHADLGERGCVSGQACVAGEPIVRSGDDTDPPVPKLDQVAGDAACAREMRGRDGGDVAGHGGTRVDHDEGEAACSQRHQLLARLRREDENGAPDVSPGGERRQRGGRLDGFSGVEQQCSAVQVKRFGDRGDDQSEIVGQQVGTPQIDRCLRWSIGGCTRAGSLHAELLHRPLDQVAGVRGHMGPTVEDSRHSRDGHARLRGDVSHRRPVTGRPTHLVTGSCFIRLSIRPRCRGHIHRRSLTNDRAG